MKSRISFLAASAPPLPHFIRSLRCKEGKVIEGSDETCKHDEMYLMCSPLNPNTCRPPTISKSWSPDVPSHPHLYPLSLISPAVDNTHSFTCFTCYLCACLTFYLVLGLLCWALFGIFACSGCPLSFDPRLLSLLSEFTAVTFLSTSPIRITLSFSKG